MPMHGGAADKIGNRYEKQWGIWALLKLLEGEHETVTIEKPGETWAEFLTESSGSTTWYQVKLKGTTASGTLSSVSSVLVDFKEKLSGGDRCVLIPGTGNDALNELATRARQSDSFSEFESKFISAKKHKANFDFMIRIWKTSPNTAYDWLKRVEVWTQDEMHTLTHNMSLAASSFDEKPATVVSIFGTIYEEQIHQKIDQQKLLGLLADHELEPKMISGRTPKAEWQKAALKQAQDMLADLKIIGKFANYTVEADTDTTRWKSLASSVSDPSKAYTDAIFAARSLVDCLENGIPEECQAQVRVVMKQVRDLQEEIDRWVADGNKDWSQAKETAEEHKYDLQQVKSPEDAEANYKASGQYKRMCTVRNRQNALVTQQDQVSEFDRRLPDLQTIIANR